MDNLNHQVKKIIVLQKKEEEERIWTKKHTWHIILGYSQISVNNAQICFRRQDQ
jgi:hypothetical protein